MKVLIIVTAILALMIVGMAWFFTQMLEHLCGDEDDECASLCNADWDEIDKELVGMSGREWIRRNDEPEP